jgi:hypothetical protein
VVTLVLRTGEHVVLPDESPLSLAIGYVARLLAHR